MNRIALVTCLTLGAACATPTAEQPLTLHPAEPGIFVARRAAVAELMRNFQRVRFEFDSSLITRDSADALAANAEILRRFEELGVEVQGHADDVGATEYNLSLGDRRATTIQRYLITAGVAPYRLATISYGEERPLSLETAPLARAANRRAEFRITIAPPAQVRGTVEEATLSAVELDFEGDDEGTEVAAYLAR